MMRQFHVLCLDGAMFLPVSAVKGPDGCRTRLRRRSHWHATKTKYVGGRDMTHCGVPIYVLKRSDSLAELLEAR